MILVTGAAGHTGRHVLGRLMKQLPGTRIRCLLRPGAVMHRLTGSNLELVSGDLAVDADVQAAIHGARVIIHIANIKYSPAIVRAAAEAGVIQVILIHTTGMFSRYRAYSAEYRHIEDLVLGTLARTQCNYTILRPTMIYGGWEDHNFHKLISVLRRWPIFPIFGTGTGKIQPVHVEDLADSIVAALDNPRAFNRAFNISGGSVVSYRQLLTLIARLLDRRVLFIRIPYTLSLAVVGLLNLFGRGPVTVEQVRRLSEDKVYDHQDAAEALSYRPRSLEAGLRQQLAEMGIKGAAKS